MRLWAKKGVEGKLVVQVLLRVCLGVATCDFE